MSIESIPQSTLRKVYYGKTRRLLRFAGSLLIAVVIAQYILRPALGINFPILFLAVFLFAQSEGSYLVTSADGIIYSCLGLYLLHTSWDNIEHVAPVNIKWSGSNQFLVLRQPVELGPWAALAAWPLSKDQRERLIPITSAWQKYDELVDDIKSHAPHITGL